ncbi:alpha/beta fold hydrolase [Actinoallomurus soli]|uniref:alpha/beta fold hydrolase n=1 Tax=Actinoallomurus soli TaxID=2952535 RepID=UPI0020921432|nr:alpha/beta hydrolase [Actinoallomurus soli]MCO5969841.1 alpha/beta hydrolase [Actinoallomurus soli]
MRTTADTLHHVEFGRGVPVLMVHGFTVDHRLMLPLESAFTDRPGWRRVYVDLPGSGRSPRLPAPVTADRTAAALMTFIDEVIGREPFAIVGISFGGQLVRHVVAELGAQVMGMCLLAPVVAPVGRRELPARQVLDRDDELLASLDPADRAVFSDIAIWQTAAGWAAFRDHVLPGLRAHHRDDARELAAAYMLSATPETRFTTHDGPHLLVTGRQDHMVGWRDQLALLEHYPRMTYAVLDGCGHNVHLDQPEQVNALLRSWLDALEAESAVDRALRAGR